MKQARGEKNWAKRQKKKKGNEMNTETESGKQKGRNDTQEPSDKVTDGNTYSLSACLYHSTKNNRPSEITSLVKQITAVDEA